jgi:ubiquinone biosynthesis monooxygenase Coq7
MTERVYSMIDELIMNMDKGLQTVFGRPIPTDRPDPAANIAETEMTEEERRMSEGFMRVDHSGEVCAQAMYQGQALTARSAIVREKMAQSAWEENDHLVWCENRVKELGGRLSYLDPFWYFGSFTLGVIAGIAGDKWSLGFVAETERQVVRHLDSHLERLPAHDLKSRAILDLMKEDELHHATVAIETGAAELPDVIKGLMKSTSKVFTGLTYYI